MAQVKPLKLLSNGEISFIDSVNDELTMKSVTADTISANAVSIGGTSLGEDLSLAGNLSVSGNVFLGDASGDSIVVNGTIDSDVNLSNGFNIVLDQGTVSGLVAPTAGSDAANKSYVDAVAQGLAIKPSAKAATTDPLSSTYDNGASGVGATLNLGPLAELNVDGVISWSLYDGILVKNQTNAFENGRYFVSQVGDGSTDWILTRCGLCDEPSEIPAMYVFVTAGTVNANTGWVAFVTTPVEVGVTDINFTQFSGAGTFVEGNGIVILGQEISMVLDGSVAFSANISASGFSLTNLADPNNDQDAATKFYVDQAVSSFDLTGYATEAYVGTEISTALTGYATETYVGTEISTALTGYATETYVGTEISTALMGYATETYVGTEISTALMGYYTSATLSSSGLGEGASLIGVHDLAGNFAASNLEDVLAEISQNVGGELDGLDGRLTTIEADYVTSVSLSNSGYATEAYVGSEISTALAGYDTSLEVDGKISTALAGYDTSLEVDGKISTALVGYATETYVGTEISTALTGYATETYVGTEISTALTGYATETYVGTEISTALTGYATETYVGTEISTALGDYYTSVQTDSAITAALSGYATEAYVDAALANIDAATAADVAISFTASGAIAEGAPVYVVSTADDTVAEGDASTVGTSRLIGIAESAVADSASGKITISGFAVIPTARIDGSSFNVGAPVYLSENTGNLTSTAPTTPGARVYQVGVATASNKLVIDLKQGITVT